MATQPLDTRLAELRETLTRWPGAAGKAWILEIHTTGGSVKAYDIKTGKAIKAEAPKAEKSQNV